MPTPLLPELTGNTLTVDVALNTPTIIRDRIAALADDQLLLPHFFHPHGAKIDGGGMLYTLLKYSDLFTTGVEKRAPLTEYPLVQGVDPETKLATVADYGGAVEIAYEEISRNNVSRLDQAATQLANEVAVKLDTVALAAVNASGIDSVAVDEPWDTLVTVGPEADLTPSADRPTAHFAQAQELADLAQLGAVFDRLLVHPSQARALRTAYAADLGKMLESCGLTMHVNARIADGTAYLVKSGLTGIVGFESPLQVVVTDQPRTKSKLLQVFVVPAFGVDKPHNTIRLTGLAS
ncbi:MAG TPA: hypothetical protein PKK01_10430 [Mycobacterium sp.]|nr:hypothetical protein [Mycobacterium sp.]HQE14511.1 hypothetical protein [Mycobacterium sp.]